MEGSRVQLLQLRSILLATDLNPGSEPAERTAVKLAAAAGARLSVIHAVPKDTDDDDMEAALARVRGIGAPVVRAHARVVRGQSVDVVLREQIAVGADTVVLGPRRHDAPNPGPLGSVAYAIVRRAHVPTLIVPCELDLPLTHVMVAVDLSIGGRMALGAAVTWATALRHPTRSEHHTTLTALYVDLADDPHRLCEEDRAQLAHQVGEMTRQAADWSHVTTRFECATGKKAAETILERQAAEDTDLLVVGTRGAPPAPNGSIGSVSDTVTRWATRPVLLVPPEMSTAPAATRTGRRSRLRA